VGKAPEGPGFESTCKIFEFNVHLGHVNVKPIIGRVKAYGLHVKIDSLFEFIFLEGLDGLALKILDHCCTYKNSIRGLIRGIENE